MWQVVSAGEDGALFVVPLESTSAPQPFVEARASASYRAVRWASQQTFVSAGTTGASPNIHLPATDLPIACHEHI